MSQPAPTSATPEEYAAFAFQDQVNALELLKSNSVTNTSNPIFDSIIKQIADNGTVRFDWSSLKVLLILRTNEILTEKNQVNPDCSEFAGECFQDQRSRILASIELFHCPPFTVQRYCELLAHPNSHYKSTRKYTNALFKLLSVSSVLPKESMKQ